jgi:tetratricopeptide (TPR) repeat protein
MGCCVRQVVAGAIILAGVAIAPRAASGDDGLQPTADPASSTSELILTQVAEQGPLRDGDPVSAEMGLHRGIAEFERANYGDALKSFETADSAGIGATYYRGLCLLALRRARDALGQLEAIRARPGAPSEVELDIGVAQLAAGDIALAEATLAKYVGDHPDDPYGHYFRGVALFRLRRDREALSEFERAASDATLAPYAGFYRGLAAYDQRDPSYRQYMDRYQWEGDQIGPASDLARRLSPPLARPTDMSVAPDRNWNFSLLTGYEYDSNVAQAPSISGLGSSSAEADSRWVLALFGDYRVIQNDDCVVGLIASTYSGWQFSADEFDVQDYMGGAYANVGLGCFILGTRYEFHETLLDDEQFATTHRLTPNVTYREGELGHVTAFYEFEASDIEGLALVPEQLRSGLLHAVGVTQAFYLFEGDGRLYLGYRFERALTDGSDFDRYTNMITGRIEVPLTNQLVADAEFRQFWDDYDNPNTLDFFDRPRTDRRVEARVGLQKFFTPHLSMRLDYSYTINDSNVTNLFGSSFYSYDRHVLSTLLVYDF